MTILQIAYLCLAVGAFIAFVGYLIAFFGMGGHRSAVQIRTVSGRFRPASGRT